MPLLPSCVIPVGPQQTVLWAIHVFHLHPVTSPAPSSVDLLLKMLRNRAPFLVRWAKVVSVLMGKAVLHTRNVMKVE